MLELVDIKKDYLVADEAVHALKGISLKFRKNEFVSILGASGCGKTTLLNIIGGLDQYTSGDLIIEGRSTKEYNDRDWDTYRNHSIGFIFQSYHLIPHQTILQNVELALMISGVSKKERRRRAIEALDKVGLKDKIHNRPNQLSGGQAQRVAIARALINDPEILLADEPTGALDSKTSVQIMELLKEISRDRLVIMVTHNPELAEKYSTRIIRLLDGQVTGDTMPYDGKDEVIKRELTKAEKKQLKKKKGSRKKTKMTPLMAMSLSMKNLLSKRKRTTMVSVAGSIGIIGVSMVLAISNGVQNYINSMENDMLSGYPVSVTQSALDYSSLMDMSTSSKVELIKKLDDKLYVKSLMSTLGSVAQGVTKTNTITEAYLAYLQGIPEDKYNLIQYDYGFDIANNIYTGFKVDNETATSADGTMSVTAIRGMYSQILSEQEEYKDFAGTVSTVATFDELPNNYEYVLSQYDVLAAYTQDGVVTSAKSLTDEQLKAIFETKESLIMVVSEQEITDLVMGQFGYLSEREFLNYAYYAVGNEMYDPEIGLVGSGKEGDNGFDLNKFIGEDSKKFTWYSNDYAYKKLDATQSAVLSGMTNMQIDFVHRAYVEGNSFAGGSLDFGGIEVPESEKGEKQIDLSVKIILQKKKDISYGCLASGFYYTNALTEHMRADCLNSEIVDFINNSVEADGSPKGYLDMLPYLYNYTCFEKDENGNTVIQTIKSGVSSIYESGSLLDMVMSGLGNNSEQSKSEMLRVKASLMGGDKLPTALYIYPVDFNTKNDITEYLDGWNKMCDNGETYAYTYDGVESSVNLSEKDKITYTDTVGLIIDMINTMIQIITIALIAFTALSLVVSTVMIGIITYVSVVERVKEIGILRAVGARKKDIKRLFNAETFIIGLVAGLIGILVTYSLSLIVNVIILIFSGIWGIAALPWWQALIMVTLSVGLTLISGLIPASAAAKKDPVVALRTE